MPSSSTLRSQPPKTGIQNPKRTMADSMEPLGFGGNEPQHRPEPDNDREADEPRSEHRHKEHAVVNADGACGESGDVEDRVRRYGEREEHRPGQQGTLGDSVHAFVDRMLRDEALFSARPARNATDWPRT